VLPVASVAPAVWHDAEAATDLQQPTGLVETTQVHRAAPATQFQLATRPWARPSAPLAQVSDGPEQVEQEGEGKAAAEPMMVPMAGMATADWQDTEAATGLIWTTQVQRAAAAAASPDMAAMPAASAAFAPRALTGEASTSGLLASVSGGAEEEESAMPLNIKMPTAMSATRWGGQTACAARPGSAAAAASSRSIVDNEHWIVPATIVEAADRRCTCEQLNNCCCWAIEVKPRASGQTRRYAVHSEAQMRFFMNPIPVGEREVVNEGRGWLPS
jgi:hypothetical protein